MTLGLVTAVTVGEARKLATQLYAKTKLGLDPAGDKLEHQARAAETFGAAVELYLTRQKTRLRPRSYAPVARHLLINAKPLHRLPLAKVDRRTIATLLAKVATSGERRHHQSRAYQLYRVSLRGRFARVLTESNPTIGD